MHFSSSVDNCVTEELCYNLQSLCWQNRTLCNETKHFYQYIFPATIKFLTIVSASYGYNILISGPGVFAILWNAKTPGPEILFNSCHLVKPLSIDKLLVNSQTTIRGKCMRHGQYFVLQLFFFICNKSLHCLFHDVSYPWMFSLFIVFNHQHFLV